MTEDEMRLLFRKTELERRAARRQVLLNHAALADEPLTEAERAITTQALEKVRASEVAYRRETRVGYWRNLWNALRGK